MEQKYVYPYNEDGYYTGRPHKCQRCPKTGGWLYPAQYSETEPPVPGERQIPRMVNGSWTLVDDYRGVKIYDTETGREGYCETYDVPAGKTLKAWPGETYDFNANADDWVENPAKKALADERTAKSALIATDSYMQRITEDLIKVLIDKKVLKLSDFSAEAQAKLAEREAKRADYNAKKVKRYVK